MLEDPYEYVAQEPFRSRLKAIAIWLGLILFGIGSLAYCANATAEPVYETSQGPVRIVVYTEKCALKEITNLPLRAVWYENGKEIEGCVGARDELGIAVIYFADRTIVALPLQMFRKVMST